MLGLSRTVEWGLATFGEAEPWARFEMAEEAFAEQRHCGGMVVKKSGLELTWKPVTRRRPDVKAEV